MSSDRAPVAVGADECAATSGEMTGAAAVFRREGDALTAVTVIDIAGGRMLALRVVNPYRLVHLRRRIAPPR